MSAIERFSSGGRWESVVGYIRAVRAGPFVFVAGTTATAPDGEILGVNDPYVQTRQALANVERALREAGAGLCDVVRTRLSVTDIDAWERSAAAMPTSWAIPAPPRRWSRSRG